MAKIDPRLLPLIETLIAADADWLAIELIQTIDRGRWPEESEDMLALARKRVRSESGEKQEVELAHEQFAPKPIPFDEQVTWAAWFVAKRLDAAIANLSGGVVNLEVILGNTFEEGVSSKRGRRSVTARIETAEGNGAGTTLMELDRAQLGMHALRTALNRWSLDANGKSPE